MSRRGLSGERASLHASGKEAKQHRWLKQQQQTIKHAERRLRGLGRAVVWGAHPHAHPTVDAHGRLGSVHRLQRTRCCHCGSVTGTRIFIEECPSKLCVACVTGRGCHTGHQSRIRVQSDALGFVFFIEKIFAHEISRSLYVLSWCVMTGPLKCPAPCFFFFVLK